MPNHSNTFELIYAAVSRIPCGRVSTYGMIAALVGNPRLARVVGWALHVNPRPGGGGADGTVPCHRVLNRFGRTCPGFAFGGEGMQNEMLRAEGIEVGGDGAVDLQKYGWPSADSPDGT